MNVVASCFFFFMDFYFFGLKHEEGRMEEVSSSNGKPCGICLRIRLEMRGDKLAVFCHELLQM